MKTFKQFMEGNVEDLNLGGRKDAQKKAIDDMGKTQYDPTAISYTHLTLPTICSV